jgi:hypothetical protein
MLQTNSQNRKTASIWQKVGQVFDTPGTERPCPWSDLHTTVYQGSTEFVTYPFHHGMFYYQPGGDKEM